jgi:hypothetical protein
MGGTVRFIKYSYLIAAFTVTASFLTWGGAPTASYADDSPATALAYGSSGWSYQQVAYAADQGFEQPSFDASNWPVGQAGFGTTDGRCAWNNTGQVKTNWDPGTDMLLRHQLAIPAGATDVHITGTIDNNAEVYVNGTLIDNVQSGNCQPDAIDVDIPAADIGTNNLLAIRATDLGDADFIDVQVTYDSPAVTTLISNSYTSVEYIEGFSVSQCTTNLIEHGIVPFESLLCQGLRTSANSAPPTRLDNTNIARFEASKEYRGYMMVPPYQLTCNAAGNEVLSVQPVNGTSFATSLGYTKLVFAYEPGESFSPQDSSFDTGTPTIVVDPDGAVTISYRWASRIATAERKLQAHLSGYDAPFVWLTFDEKISCDGQQAARFVFNNFPSTDLYINGREVSHDKESNNFAKFIKQGGRYVNPPGYGNLAFPCHVKQFDNGNSHPVYSYDACSDNQLPAGAGTGGGGSL